MWQAKLAGDAFDLETIESIFSTGDPTVSVDASGDYLLESASFFDALSQWTEVQVAADLLLERMNGAAKAQDLSYRPVRLGDEFRDVQGGVVVNTVRALTAEVRARAHVAAAISGGTIPKVAPVPPGKEWVSLAESSTDVAEVLGLLGSDSRLTWQTLYKILEIISHDVGSQQGVRDHGWTSMAQLKEFTRAADHPEVSGREARHARMRGSSPKRSMTLDEGRALIQTLFRSWVDWIVAGKPPA
jgi:hypothetical protein